MSNKKDNSTIHKIYKDLVASASNIPNFQIGQIRDVKYDITELANNCVIAQDKHDDYWSDIYFNALLVRYWHMIAKIYDMLKQFKVSVEEVVNILFESMSKAMKYRSWLNDDKYISKSSRGAEKVINQCITSTVSNYIKAFNIKSVKMLVDNDDEEFETSVTYNDSYDAYFGCSELVQKLIDKQNYFTAMIVDLISYKDLTSKNLLSDKLSCLDNNYVVSFMSRYRIKYERDFVAMIKSFEKMTKQEISKEVSRSMKYLKNNESLVRSIIC